VEPINGGEGGELFCTLPLFWYNNTTLACNGIFTGLEAKVENQRRAMEGDAKYPMQRRAWTVKRRRAAQCGHGTAVLVLASALGYLGQKPVHGKVFCFALIVKDMQCRRRPRNSPRRKVRQALTAHL